MILCSLTFPTFARNFCAPGICTFGSLDKPNDSAEFYCETSKDVSLVEFQNHNVNISGFDGNGVLVLRDGDVNKLKTYYFKVSTDPNHSSSALKTVTYTVDGKTKCSIGKGGRKLPFNALFKAI